jgi:hypothetical protein
MGNLRIPPGQASGNVERTEKSRPRKESRSKRSRSWNAAIFATLELRAKKVLGCRVAERPSKSPPLPKRRRAGALHERKRLTIAEFATT